MNSVSSGPSTVSMHPDTFAKSGNVSRSGASASTGENVLSAPLPPRISGYMYVAASGGYIRTSL
eukprot:CAMPEP_0181393026 /NCGR_PEP_ID=MMETSP1106-20121128/26941_1 /TAXON_ID=81844 /ORGANISM="Mantoniella antarctica, Strain SL-175" /LENGTH=63 /DNA_ID=CAMNT_0023514261 /DNA_START=445 /DNA_END=636 /DNA_ORIENTATION=+